MLQRVIGFFACCKLLLGIYKGKEKFDPPLPLPAYLVSSFKNQSIEKLFDKSYIQHYEFYCNRSSIKVFKEYVTINEAFKER